MIKAECKKQGELHNISNLKKNSLHTVILLIMEKEDLVSYTLIYMETIYVSYVRILFCVVIVRLS